MSEPLFDEHALKILKAILDQYSELTMYRISRVYGREIEEPLFDENFVFRNGYAQGMSGRITDYLEGKREFDGLV